MNRLTDRARNDLKVSKDRKATTQQQLSSRDLIIIRGGGVEGGGRGGGPRDSRGSGNLSERVLLNWCQKVCYSQVDTQTKGTIFQPMVHSDRVVFRAARRT